MSEEKRIVIDRRYNIEDARAFAEKCPDVLVWLMDKYANRFQRVGRDLLSNPNYDFRYHVIKELTSFEIRLYCENPRVTQVDMLNLPECDEKYRGFSANPNCTIELVQLFKNKAWDYYVLFKNSALCAASLRDVFKSLMDDKPELNLYVAILYNTSITIEVFEECRRYYAYNYGHYKILAQNRGIYPCDLKHLGLSGEYIAENPNVLIEDLRDLGLTTSWHWLKNGNIYLKYLKGIPIPEEYKAALAINPNKTLDCLSDYHEMFDKRYFVMNPNASFGYLCRKIEDSDDPDLICQMISTNLFSWHPLFYEQERNKKLSKALVIQTTGMIKDLAEIVSSYY
jgi:hypothetical protein